MHLIASLCPGYPWQRSAPRSLACRGPSSRTAPRARPKTTATKIPTLNVIARSITARFKAIDNACFAISRSSKYHRRCSSIRLGRRMDAELSSESVAFAPVRGCAAPVASLPLPLRTMVERICEMRLNTNMTSRLTRYPETDRGCHQENSIAPVSVDHEKTP
jgi:hypothetical protein